MLIIPTTAHELVFLAWYNGEASTAVIIANIPFCYPLIRRIFGLESWGGSSGSNARRNARFANGDNAPPLTIGSVSKRGNQRNKGDSLFGTVLTRRDSTSESVERMTGKDAVMVYDHDIELGEQNRVR
jgi:hypothetical protein